MTNDHSPMKNELPATGCERDCESLANLHFANLTLTPSLSELLVTERLDGIQACRDAGGPDAEDQANSGGNGQSSCDGPQRDLRGEIRQKKCENHAHDKRKDNTDSRD